MGANRAETEMAVRQIRFALAKLAKLHGNPKHIGCSYLPNQENPEGPTLFVYFSKPETTYPDEIMFSPNVIFMFHKPDDEQEQKESPVYSRKGAHMALMEALSAVGN